MLRPPPTSTPTDQLFPYTPLFRSIVASNGCLLDGQPTEQAPFLWCDDCARGTELPLTGTEPRAAGCGCNHDWTHAEGNRFARKHHQDRKSTRLNSSH